MSYIGNYKNSSGKRVASVTTVIGQLGWNRDMLMAWQNRLWEQGKDPRKVSKEACDVGTVTHELIEAWIFGQDEYEQDDGVEDSVVVEASAGLRDYIKWSEDNEVKYLESEIRMVSEEHQYAGTADCIAEINGKTVLIDFKTSKNIYDSHIIQLAAYKAMIEETTDYKIDECIVVKIDKGEVEKGTSRIHAHTIDNGMLDSGWEVFKTCLDLKKYRSDFGKYLRQENKK